jgi:tetratricopeptide (TPR) repeat protein
MTLEGEESVETPLMKRGDTSIHTALAAISILIIAALAVAAYSRNSIYQNDVTLWASVVKSAPEKRRAHENYGQALSTAGLFKNALEEFKKVIELKDDGSVPPRDLYREIGVVYFRLGKMTEAVTFWKMGLREAPGDPALLNNLSMALLSLGRDDEAVAAAELALAVDPSMLQALTVMGQVAMSKKDYDNAAQYFIRAIDRDPFDPARYWDAAMALQEAKKYDQAYEYAAKYSALENNPAAKQMAQEYLRLLKIKMRK